MKNAFLLLIVGALIGALSYHVYLKKDARPASAPVASVVDRTKEAAGEAKQAVTTKLVDWNLTSADIQADLAQAGKVVRSKARAARETMSDARIIAVLKGKYALESNLSALAITIDCTAGRVTLRGEAASAELIGQAIRLALETEGVTEVESLLTLPAAG